MTVRDSDNHVLPVLEAGIENTEQNTPELRAHYAKLEVLRQKVLKRWMAQTIDDHPLMSDTLPPGIPPVRFGPNSEMKKEVDLKGEPPPASAPRSLSVDQLAELRKQLQANNSSNERAKRAVETLCSTSLFFLFHRPIGNRGY